MSPVLSTGAKIAMGFDVFASTSQVVSEGNMNAKEDSWNDWKWHSNDNIKNIANIITSVLMLPSLYYFLRVKAYANYFEANMSQDCQDMFKARFELTEAIARQHFGSVEYVRLVTKRQALDAAKIYDPCMFYLTLNSPMYAYNHTKISFYLKPKFPIAMGMTSICGSLGSLGADIFSWGQLTEKLLGNN